MKVQLHKLFCRIPVKLFSKVQKAAEKRGLSITAYVIMKLEEGLE